MVRVPGEFNPPTDEQKRRISEAISNTAISGHFPQIVNVAQNCIQFTSFMPADEAPIGSSRLGGLPDLPPQLKWPKHFSFMAQLNL